MLNFNIRGENIEVTPAIREHVENKVIKTRKVFYRWCERDCKRKFESV